MAKDDFEVVAYKILAYLYGCLKEGVAPSVVKAQEVTGVNTVYFYAVLSSLSSKGFVEPINAMKDINGDIIDIAGNLTITIDGVAYLSENATMKKVSKFLGAAFEKVLEIAIKATLSL